MILIVPAAAISYAYAEDAELLPHLAFAAFLVLLGTATLGAKFTRGSKRLKMFWKGAAAFGWGYLVVGLYLGLIFQDSYMMLSRSIIGLVFALLTGYITLRVVPRTPPPPVPEPTDRA